MDREAWWDTIHRVNRVRHNWATNAMNNDVENFYVSVSHLYIFFRKLCIRVLCLFLISFFCAFCCCWVLYILKSESSLYILDIKSLSYVWFTNIFCHSVDGHFTLFIYFLYYAEMLELYVVRYAYFCFCHLGFGIVSKK